LSEYDWQSNFKVHSCIVQPCDGHHADGTRRVFPILRTEVSHKIFDVESFDTGTLQYRSGDKLYPPAFCENMRQSKAMRVHTVRYVHTPNCPDFINRILTAAAEVIEKYHGC